MSITCCAVTLSTTTYGYDGWTSPFTVAQGYASLGRSSACVIFGIVIQLVPLKATRIDSSMAAIFLEFAVFLSEIHKLNGSKLTTKYTGPFLRIHLVIARRHTSLGPS